MNLNGFNIIFCKIFISAESVIGSHSHHDSRTTSNNNHEYNSNDKHDLEISATQCPERFGLFPYILVSHS